MGEAGYRLERERIVCFSTADWDTLLPTNKHQLMQRLARRNRVLFVETLGTRAPRLGSAVDLGRIGRRLRRGFQGPVRREKYLWTLSPLVRPVWSTPAAQQANRLAFRMQAREALARFADAIVWVYSPYAVHLLDLFDPRLVVYHMVDDLSAVPGANAGALREAEIQLLARADCVFCTERGLHDRARSVNPKARFMPNVADYGHFSRPRTDAVGARLELLRMMPRPRLLFSGNLAPHKVDLEMLAMIARRRPDWSVVLVGPKWEGAAGHPLFERLDRLPNVHLLGHVPYDDLPAYLAEAEVLLIPYVENDATRAVFPLKFFEYLATGRPVVSSPLPSLLPYGGAVHFARDADEWIAACERALADTHDLELQRRALARRHTWERRIEEMEAAIGETLHEKRAR
ncbi:MAG: glycosyltransferase [Candidatus Sumerlaeia bacterium]|nr:glycosyltransferase [Candidatus Sumerlaeia bacterium]